MKPMQPMTPMKSMEPMQPLGVGEAWWPTDLGKPSTAGGQDGMRYAVFPDKRRLAIERGDERTIYDTGDHTIGGVQQQSGELVFASGSGSVGLDTLKVVE